MTVTQRHSKPAPDFPRPYTTVDVVIFTIAQGRLNVLRVQRPCHEDDPFPGLWALPGGFVNVDLDADLQACAARKLKEKTGVDSPYLEQLGSWGSAARDPRGWSVAISYCELIPQQQLPAHRSDLKIVPVHAAGQLPFDHGQILQTALARVRSKSQYSSLPVYFLGESFSLPQLQQVYESILGEPLNKVSFRRKMDELGMLEPVPGEMQGGGAHRPAQLHRVRPAFRQQLALSVRGL